MPKLEKKAVQQNGSNSNVIKQAQLRDLEGSGELEMSELSDNVQQVHFHKSNLAAAEPEVKNSPREGASSWLQQLPAKPEQDSVSIEVEDDEISPEKKPNLTHSYQMKLDQLEIESAQFWLGDMFVERPCTIMIVGYCLLALATYIAFKFNYFQMEEQGKPREFLIWKHQLVEDWDMQVLAKQYIEKFEGGSANKQIQTQYDQHFSFVLLYQDTKPKDYGLLSKENLLKVKKIEDDAKGHSLWSKTCLNDVGEVGCSSKSYLSPLQIFPLVGLTDLQTASQEQILQSFQVAMNQPAIWDIYSSLFDSNVKKGQSYVKYMRSSFNLAGPLEHNGIRYHDKSDRWVDQKKIYKEFQLDINDHLLTYYPADDINGFKVEEVSTFIRQQAFSDAIAEDSSFAIFSVIFVFLYFIIHLRSLFLAFIGITLIIFSFPVTVCLTEGIFRVTYFSNLHSLAVFIVLGIAADDIFVFIDAWRQSEKVAPRFFRDDKKLRMAYAWRRSVRAMAVTSSTTSVAFIANVFSPIMPIKAFGIFAGVIIPVNYILVVTFLPPATIFFEEHIEGRFCKFIGSFRQSTSDRVIHISRNDSQIYGLDAVLNDELDASNYSKIERFFNREWNNTVKKFRWVIIVLATLWSAFAAYQSTMLGPMTEQENFVAEDHPSQVRYSIVNQHFSRQDEEREPISFYWGPLEIFKGKRNYWDSDQIGEIVMDPDFSISKPEEQLYLIQFCKDMRNQEFLVHQDTTDCWFEDFQHYLQSSDIEFPINDETEFNKLIYTWANSSLKGKEVVNKKYIGFMDQKPIYVEFTSLSDVNLRDPAAVKTPRLQQVNDFVSMEIEKAPKGLKSLRQVCRSFLFIPTEQAFYYSAVSGMLIALSFSFLVLLIATRNIITSVLSIVCVTMVIGSVVCIMVMKGWQLGVSESISIVVIIGFSVDYTVHLAADYMHSPHSSRSDKMRQAYTEMGVSILSGTITTLGAGAFLFGGQVVIFQKFAVLITGTISISFFTAMVVYGAFLHICGPEEGFGSVCAKKPIKQVSPDK